jgi:hypothetical protein
LEEDLLKLYDAVLEMEAYSQQNLATQYRAEEEDLDTNYEPELEGPDEIRVKDWVPSARTRMAELCLLHFNHLFRCQFGSFACVR